MRPPTTIAAAVWYEATLAALVTLLDERGILPKHEIQQRMEELIQEEVLRQNSTPAGTS